jgi:hypothetical protein
MISSVFKSRIPSVSYIFKDGMAAYFILGKFITANEKQIAELEAEVVAGHPHIYIDEAEATIDSEALTPIELIRKEAYEQAMADIQRALSSGTSESDNGNVAATFGNSATIAQGGEANSNSFDQSGAPAASATDVKASLTKLTATLAPKK